MRIFNQDKTKELKREEIDLEKGYLIADSIMVPEVPFVKEVYHYETIREYENGGKDVEKVIDVPGQDFVPAHKQAIQVYIPYTDEELEEIRINNLRLQREYECFSVINRGKLWYDNLTEAQLAELDTWYKAWLDVTETGTIPQKPEWLK